MGILALLLYAHDYNLVWTVLTFGPSGAASSVCFAFSEGRNQTRLGAREAHSV